MQTLVPQTKADEYGPAAITALAKGHRRRRQYLWAAVAASIVATALLVVLGLSRWTYHPAPVVLPRQPEASLLQPAPVQPPEAQEAYSQSLDRLSDALNEFPGLSAPEVLHAVSRRDRDCAFEWNDGNAALVYGAGKSIATSLGLCAAAVEKFRNSGRTH